jgi:hypothetical protein
MFRTRQSLIYTDFECFKSEFHVFKRDFNPFLMRLLRVIKT